MYFSYDKAVTKDCITFCTAEDLDFVIIISLFSLREIITKENKVWKVNDLKGSEVICPSSSEHWNLLKPFIASHYNGSNGFSDQWYFNDSHDGLARCQSYKPQNAVKLHEYECNKLDCLVLKKITVNVTNTLAYCEKIRE